MHYDLAGGEHDVDRPEGPSPLRQAYVLCSTPRSGSTLLSEALHASGKAGTPIEYFDGTDTMAALADRWGCRNLRCYIACLHRRRTSPDGLLGAKLHWYQLQELTVALGPVPLAGDCGAQRAALDAAFPGAQLLYVVRRDVDRQAVSWAVAEATGRWVDMGNTGTPPLVPYDFDAIDDCRRRLELAEDGWRRLFAAGDIAPLTVSYEDLAEDLARTVALVARHVGVDLQPDELPAPRLQRQANAHTEMLVRTYQQERAAGRARVLDSPRGLGLFADAHPGDAATAALHPDAFPSVAGR